ncbi:MAG: hypothetical protein KA965_05290 [Butyrivibrio sp.]|nr:hypothetical protein [Butyrivibrio sp.]
MDFKIIRLAVLMFISLLALILVVIYATNTDRIDTLINGASDASAESAISATEGLSSDFGEQIGDNLKAFLTDETFFDQNNALAEISSQNVESVSMEVRPEKGSITVKIMNERGGLETGNLFSVTVTAEKNQSKAKSSQTAKETVYADNDLDGIIKIDDLPIGSYFVKMQEISGYHIPVTGVTAEVTESAGDTAMTESSDSEAGSNADSSR